MKADIPLCVRKTCDSKEKGVGGGREAGRKKERKKQEEMVLLFYLLMLVLSPFLLRFLFVPSHSGL